MPAVKGAKQTKDEIARLKQQFLDYYKDVPIQRYAAYSIKRDEETISRWKLEDPDFAEAIQVAKSIFVSKNVLKTKADWKLERMVRDEFGPNLDITSKGEKITPILGGSIGLPGNDGDQEDRRSPEAD